MIQYIIKALLNDNSIFINDLGTFTKTYQSARFDGDTMLPPQYVVTLTVKDDQPDSTEFINLVCREKQCRITEASAEINRWVEELKTAIENNKEVEYDNFGTFSLNNKGVITFVCDHIDELNREFEGMGIVRLGEEVKEVQGVQEVKVVNELNEVNEVNVDEERRLHEEAMQRLKEAEEQERLAKEAEEKRLQEEAEQRLREAQEQERLAKEAEERRLQEEAEQRLKEAQEQERLAKEAEEKRLQEEANQRLREAEEQERLAKEAEERRLQEEAEEKEEQEEKEVKVVENGAGTNDKKPAKRRKNKRRSWWWLLVLLILIVLGVLGYLFRQQLIDTFHRIKMEFSPTNEEVITEEDEEVAEETATYEEEVTPEEKEEEVATESEVYTPEVVRTTATGNYPVIRFEQGHYYVIAGSLPTEQDAVRHIKQRNLDQYEPKIVMQPGANLRVCIGIFDTEEEAETFAKNVNPKYWVLK